MTARKKDEHHFQFAVGALCDALRLVWFHCPNELAGFITPGHYAQLVGQGFKPGVPDVMIQSRLPARREARGAFLELKAATGSAGTAQKLWSARLRAEGYVGGLYRTFDAVCAFFRECGWDVDGALRDIEARGWVVAGDRLVRSK